MSTDKLSKQTVVYQIFSIVGDYRFYIGSAMELYARYGTNPDWKKHHNSGVREHAEKYGNDTLILSVIQVCSSYEEALCMEQWWLDFYHTYNNLWDCLYNRNKSVYKWRCDNTGMKLLTSESGKKGYIQAGLARRGKKLNISETVREGQRARAASLGRARRGKKRNISDARRAAIVNMNTARRGTKKNLSEAGLASIVRANSKRKGKKLNLTSDGRTALVIAGALRSGEKSPSYRHDIDMEVVVTLYNAGVKITKIAQQLNIPYGTIYSRLRSHDSYKLKNK